MRKMKGKIPYPKQKPKEKREKKKLMPCIMNGTRDRGKTVDP